MILVVEDEPDIRLVIQVCFSKDPRLKVIGEATSAAEAIESARTKQPDLIILDHNLEGDVSGIDAAPALKEAAPDSKILLFTAFDSARRVAAEPAVDRYLRKTHIDQLLETVLDLAGLSPR